MTETILQFVHLDRFGWRSLVDILVLSAIIYQILRIFQGTRAFRMLYGIFVLAVAYILTGPGRVLALPTVNRVLGYLLLFSPLAIVVLFQNHIRRMLAFIGTNPLAGLGRASAAERMVDEIVLAVATLASKRHGALIVFEREQGLRTFAETGIAIDAQLSYDLLTTIFMPHTPLHDGAVIIADGRIRAASCFLPLSANPRLSREFGSRHRAAIGITEETDAVAVAVSEENGQISLVREGKIRRGLEPRELSPLLLDLLVPPAVRRFGRTDTHARAEKAGFVRTMSERTPVDVEAPLGGGPAPGGSSPGSGADRREAR